MTIPISSSISSNRQINQTDSTPANTASNSTATSLHNVQKGQQASDTEKILVRAVRSNGVSMTRAAHALARQNLSAGPDIKSTTTTATPQHVMSGNQVKASVAQASLTPALKINQVITTGSKAVSANEQSGLSTLERTQTKAVLTELITIIDRKADKKTGAALSGTIYFAKGSQGRVNLQKVPASKDTPSAQKKYLASPEAMQARELAGSKLESLFKKAGIEVTNEIRQALPNKTSMGDVRFIRDAIEVSLLKISQAEKNEKLNTPSTKQQVLAALKDDLSKMPWSDLKSTETLFRENSIGSRKLVGHLEGTFTESAIKCAALATNAANECLKKTNSVDLAMVAAHETLLASLADVHLTTDLEKLAASMIGLIDEVATAKVGTKIKNGPEVYTQAMVTVYAAKLKEKILATILLRTFVNEVSDEMSLSTAYFKRSVETLTGKIPPSEASFARIGDKLQKLFNGQIESKTMQGVIADMRTTSPKYADFLADTSKNNINSFTDFNELSTALIKPKN